MIVLCLPWVQLMDLNGDFFDIHQVQRLPHFGKASAAEHALQQITLVVQGGQVAVEAGSLFAMASLQLLVIHGNKER